MTSAHRRRVLILGGGFAGISVAQELSALCPAGDIGEIALVDLNNFSLFTPMLTEVVGGEVYPVNIVAAIRSMCPGVMFEQGTIDHIDAGARKVRVTVGNGLGGVEPATRTLEADHLVIALGSVTNFHHITGLEQHALTIKTVADAVSIRNRALTLLERADEEEDRDVRRALLTFVVGGGGFSGVETAAALNGLLRDLVPRYRHIDSSDLRCLLAQPGDRLLPEINAGLAGYAQGELERRGVDVMLHTAVNGAGPGYVELKMKGSESSERVAAHTLIWAGGVQPNPVVQRSGLPLGKHGGIVVDECCAVPGHSGIWALGDAAEVPRPGGKGTYAPTAQNAIREGPLVARNIVAAMRGERQKPFVYHPVGELALVGKRAGVASVYGLHVSGFPAWLMWRAVYLAKLPNTAKRVQVGINWLLDALFGREVTALPGVRAGGRAQDSGA